MTNNGNFTATIVPILDLSHCKFIKERKTLVVNSNFTGGRFPAKIKVRSHITNIVLEFVPVTEDDPLFDQDGWDGEQAIYRVTSQWNSKVEYLVIHHG